MRNLLASMLFGLLALLGATQAQATCGSGGGTCYAIGVIMPLASPARLTGHQHRIGPRVAAGRLVPAYRPPRMLFCSHQG